MLADKWAWREASRDSDPSRPAVAGGAGTLQPQAILGHQLAVQTEAAAQMAGQSDIGRRDLGR